MRFKTEYISIGGNRSASCSARSPNGVVAFGAGKLVALWNSDVGLVRIWWVEILTSQDVPGKGVYDTLPGHKGHVTSIKLLERSDGAANFVSGDAAGEIRIWQSGPKGSVRLMLSRRWISDQPYVSMNARRALSHTLKPRYRL